jgi:hypothetical protein
VVPEVIPAVDPLVLPAVPLELLPLLLLAPPLLPVVPLLPEPDPVEPAVPPSFAPPELCDPDPPQAPAALTAMKSAKFRRIVMMAILMSAPCCDVAHTSRLLLT